MLTGVFFRKPPVRGTAIEVGADACRVEIVLGIYNWFRTCRVGFDDVGSVFNFDCGVLLEALALNNFMFLLSSFSRFAYMQIVTFAQPKKHLCIQLLFVGRSTVKVVSNGRSKERCVKLRTRSMNSDIGSRLINLLISASSSSAVAPAMRGSRL